MSDINEVMMAKQIIDKDKRIALLSSEVMENARRVGKQQKHSDIATNCWIECLLKKAVDDLEMNSTYLERTGL